MEDKKTMIANLKFMSEKSKKEAERLMDIHNKVLICLKKGTPRKLLDLLEARKKEGKDGISIEDLSNIVDYDMIIPDGFVQFDLSCKDYDLFLNSSLVGPLEDQDLWRRKFIESVLFRLTCIYGSEEVYRP